MYNLYTLHSQTVMKNTYFENIYISKYKNEPCACVVDCLLFIFWPRCCITYFNMVVYVVAFDEGIINKVCDCDIVYQIGPISETDLSNKLLTFNHHST